MCTETWVQRTWWAQPSEPSWVGQSWQRKHLDGVWWDPIPWHFKSPKHGELILEGFPAIRTTMLFANARIHILQVFSLPLAWELAIQFGHVISTLFIGSTENWHLYFLLDLLICVPSKPRGYVWQCNQCFLTVRGIVVAGNQIDFQAFQAGY